MAEYPKVATITLHTVPRCYLLGSARPIDFNVSLKRESNASALVPIRKSSIAVLSSPLGPLNYCTVRVIAHGSPKTP